MRRLFFLVALFLLVSVVPEDAYAYLDPASGSMLLQLLLAGVAGLLVLLRLFWRRILRVLGLGGKQQESAASKAEAAEETREEPKAG